MMETMTAEVLRIPDAAARLGVSTKEAYRLIDEGGLHADAHIDGWRAITTTEVERFLASAGENDPVMSEGLASARWVNVVAVLRIEPASAAHDVGDVLAGRVFVPGNADVVLFADLEHGTVTITVPVELEEVEVCAAMLAGYADPALGVVSIEITHHTAGDSGSVAEWLADRHQVERDAMRERHAREVEELGRDGDAC